MAGGGQDATEESYKDRLKTFLRLRELPLGNWGKVTQLMKIVLAKFSILLLDYA